MKTQYELSKTIWYSEGDIDLVEVCEQGSEQDIEGEYFFMYSLYEDALYELNGSCETRLESVKDFRTKREAYDYIKENNITNIWINPNMED